MKDRFESFIKNSYIKISEREVKIIWEGNKSLRQQRNDIEHGRKTDINLENLAIMDFVITKMIIGIIN